MNEPSLQSVAELAAQAGYTVDIPPRAIAGGRNNRAYVVDTQTEPLFLKQYFRESDDSRERLAAEFSFARFAWSHGVRVIPEPIVSDQEHRLGLFAFVAGRSLQPSEVTVDRVNEALDLFEAINNHRAQEDAANLPNAAEACFSHQEHLDLVAGRVENLLRRELNDHKPDSVDREYQEFVNRKLDPVWNDVRTKASCAEENIDLSRKLLIPSDQRCLSPSDFGFHNALLTPDGRLVFYDFEYAGWDDPAKMVCDFFCQVQLPVPSNCWEMVVNRVVKLLRLPAEHCRRMELLLPVYRVKWCCIMLNEFLREGAQRRRFAREDDDFRETRRGQLDKARMCLARLTSSETY